MKHPLIGLAAALGLALAVLPAAAGGHKNDRDSFEKRSKPEQKDWDYRKDWKDDKDSKDFSKFWDKGRKPHHHYEGPRNPVPEPGTYAMLAAGLAGVGFAVRRRRKN